MPLQSDKLRLLRRIPDIRFEEETRGYSKDQVDRVLANLAPLADEIERLQGRLSEAESRAASAEARLVEARSPSQGAAPGMPPAPQPDFDETLRNTLVSAQRQADTTIREAREEAERLRTEAEFQSNALLADARDQSAEMTTEAVAYRERLMAEAAAERAKMLEEARDEAQARVESVEKELAEAHEGERTRLVNQIGELQENHKLLQDDVVRFEQHLQARTSEVRAALEEMTAVLDDPERLRSKDGIEPADIQDLEPDNYSPIAVEVVALNELEAEAEAASEATARPGEVLNAADLDDLAPDPESYADEVAEAAEEPDDPQVGVQTQVVAAPNFDGPNGAHGGDQAAAEAGDPFLDELRRVTTEDPGEADAISEFLDDKPRGDRQGGNTGGWFGRRK
ncbi:MAG: DivIVA domain-containing protein [Actinomycetota bacterium]